MFVNPICLPSRCIHCSLSRANVRCSHAGCNATFHYTCGAQHGAFYEYRGAYASLCAGAHAAPRARCSNVMRVADKVCLAGCRERTLNVQRWVGGGLEV